MRVIKVLLFTLLLFIILAPAAQAAASLAITPMKLEYSLKPGESVSRTITASNPGDTPLQVNTQSNDYKVTSQGVPIFAAPSEDPFSAGSWLQVEPTNFTLKPGETKSISLTVKAPLRADPGEHYGAILFQFGGTAPQAGVGVTGRIAVVNVITLPGSVDKKGVVQQFSIPFLNASYPVPMQLSLGNIGNVHLPMDGVIEISSWVGQQVVSVPFTQGSVFPNSVKTIELTMTSGSRFGFYKATLKLKDTAITNTSDPVPFIVFPWALVLGIILAAFGLYKLGALRGNRKQ